MRHRLSLDTRTELGHTYSPTKHARGSRGPGVATEVRPPQLESRHPGFPPSPLEISAPPPRK